MPRNKRKTFTVNEAIKNPMSLQDSINKDDLYCVVCMDLPITKEIYQCKNSHLLCSGCHSKILEKDYCICPFCRIKLSRDNPCRSRLAETIISKLVVLCPNPNCGEKLHNENLKKHEKDHCAYRTTRCKFNPIGCDWKGIAKSKRKHEKSCEVRSLDANAILKKTIDKNREREAFERKRIASFEADRRLVANLSQRNRNIVVRDVNVYKQISKFNKGIVMSSYRITVFTLVLFLDILRNDAMFAGDKKDEGVQVSKKQTAIKSGKLFGKGETNTEKSLSNKESIHGTTSPIKKGNEKSDGSSACRANEHEHAIQRPEEKQDYVRARLRCIKMVDKKKRIEAFLLGGPQLFCRLKPTFTKFTFTETDKETPLFSLPFTKSQAEELFNSQEANFRIVLFDKENGLDMMFAVNQRYSIVDDQNDYENDDMYEDDYDYSDDYNDLDEIDYDQI